jgi:hypothetical protein
VEGLLIAFGSTAELVVANGATSVRGSYDGSVWWRSCPIVRRKEGAAAILAGWWLQRVPLSTHGGSSHGIDAWHISNCHVESAHRLDFQNEAAGASIARFLADMRTLQSIAAQPAEYLPCTPSTLPSFTLLIRMRVF